MRIRLAHSLAFISVLLGSCSNPQNNAEMEDDLPKLEELQALASRQCECRLVGFPSQGLAKEFDDLTDGLGAKAFGTASYPVSYESVCFSKLEDDCVLTGVVLNGSPNTTLCTAEQGRELEMTFEAHQTDPFGPTEQAFNAAQNRAKEIQNETLELIRKPDCS